MSVTQAEMKRAVAHIVDADSRFKIVVDSHPLCTIGSSAHHITHFESLVESVISQQLAVKAADTIHGRLLALAGGKITPARISKLVADDLRGVGISGAKVKTIQGLSKAALSGEVAIKDLHLLEDVVVFGQLTSLWGIGPWTVDMFMMFQLGRLDIWPTGDLGVRRGWEKLHCLKEQIEPQKLHIRGEKFRPYRSVVAWYCWRALEKK